MGFYTNDQSVHDKMKQAWYVLSVFVFFDCMQGVDAGNITGLGIQNRVKWVTLFGYWVVGIPLSIFLSFKLDMALEGIWYGPTMAVFLNFLFYEYEIRSADWDKIAKDTIAKI